MDVWNVGKKKASMASLRLYDVHRQLTVSSELAPDTPVNFMRYMDIIKEVNSTLYSQKTLYNPDYPVLERQVAIAGELAQSDVEQRLAKWQTIAVVTLPRPANISGLSLVTDLDEYLSGSIDAVSVATKQQDTEMKKIMYDRGQNIIVELGEKLNSTIDTINNVLLPAIDNEFTSLEKVANETIDRIKMATDNVEKDKQKLKDLEKKKNAARFFSIFGKVVGLLGGLLAVAFPPAGAVVGVVGGSIAVGGDEWGNDLDSMISELKEEISKQMKLGEDYGIILELLTSTEELLKSMRKAGSSGGLGLRAWLVSPAMLDFRSKLVIMTPEHFEAAQSGSYLASILSDICQNVIGAMDKSEYYIGQINIISQLTPPLPSTGDSPEISPYIVPARTTVYKNMVLSNHRTVRRGMQLYAYPFCSVISESLAESCEAGRTLEELVRCASDDFTRLRAAIKQDSSTSSRSGAGLSCATFDVAHNRDTSFTTWTNAEYGSQIRDLLAGKRVLLNADVATSLEDTFAVKFNAVSLKFWHGNYSKHQELHKALEQGFRLHLTHMGNSYFKCGSDVVTFPHRLVTLLASFSVHANGEPEFASEDYLKFQRGDAFLSPYATWAAQLLPVTARGSPAINFSTLKAYADDVSMSLVGYGTSVSSASHCQECDWPDFHVAAKRLPVRVIPKIKHPLRPSIPSDMKLKASSRHCPWRPLATE
ncbi:uncharacterized protein LOC113214242 [Frankliniella occidentalis]|uniref:Uncharacterized protein LOC113214242 n=1 Tax=Frankliniella occidentalis TaxID=133901 RepID=A0A6J1T903_FRAOC|nr:uncharacterized protein LOC113214242 [Frankliniella occidentalis]